MSSGQTSTSSKASTVVVPMTAQLFARGTKQCPTDVREQEKALQDELVLIRHGERFDHADKSWKGNALLPIYDPPLSDTGRRQAFETALHYYSCVQGKSVEERINGTFSYVLVSPFHRCMETAIILSVVGFQGRLAIFVEPQLSDWQQSKVFRVAPTLGGCFGVPGRKQPNAKSLLFYPQLEALRTQLLPFFRTRETDAKFLEAHTVAPALAKRWAPDLEAWLDTHTALPVWTGAPTHDALQDTISHLKNAGAAANTEVTATASVNARASAKKDGRGGRGRGSATNSPSPAPISTGPNGEPAVAQCGAAYPETKSDLSKRCELFLNTHFSRDATVQSTTLVPPLVTSAVEAERKSKLPKYFQRFEERPEAVRMLTTSPALLPPMRVMAVTHADIISTVLQVGCPRYRASNEGFSVPSASVTTIVRYNNYYRIPPVDERAAAGSAGGAKGAHSRNKGKGGGVRGAAAPPLQRPRILTLHDKEEREHRLAPLPTEWRVEGTVGSVEMLHTRVVIHYT